MLVHPEHISYFRMAKTLWSSKTPGAAQLERDIAVMNNKKKVGGDNGHFLPPHTSIYLQYQDSWLYTALSVNMEDNNGDISTTLGPF